MQMSHPHSKTTVSWIMRVFFCSPLLLVIRTMYHCLSYILQITEVLCTLAI